MHLTQRQQGLTCSSGSIWLLVSSSSGNYQNRLTERAICKGHRAIQRRDRRLGDDSVDKIPQKHGGPEFRSLAHVLEAKCDSVSL